MFWYVPSLISFWKSNYMYAIFFCMVPQVPKCLLIFFNPLFCPLYLRLDNLFWSSSSSLNIFLSSLFYWYIHRVILKNVSDIDLSNLEPGSLLLFLYPCWELFYRYEHIFFYFLENKHNNCFKNLCLLIPISRISQSLFNVYLFFWKNTCSWLLIYWVILNYILDTVNYML